MSLPTRRYRIVKPVGKGGFGVVYHAQLIGEGGFKKDVAVKLLNGDADELEDIAARHRDEARLLGLIRHRSILQVDGLVRLNGTWAVVMEYVDGANLLQVLKAGPIPLSCAIEVGAEVAGALRVAHSAKREDGAPLCLVHRDIKPPNIQLTTAGEVKLLDFGIARASFDTRESETIGVILGTLTYMSPERLDGIDGPEGDIYALGVCLVESAARRRMKKTSSSRERHAETVRLADTYLEEALGEYAQGLRGLIRRMLAYDAEDRPDAGEVERVLWRLREEAGAPRLAEWAETGVRVAQELASAKLESAELTGEFLTEQSRTMMLTGQELLDEEKTEVRKLYAAGGLVAVGVVLFFLAGGALGVLWFVGTFDPLFANNEPEILEAAGPEPVVDKTKEPRVPPEVVSGEKSPLEEARRQAELDRGEAEVEAQRLSKEALLEEERLKEAKLDEERLKEAKREEERLRKEAQQAEKKASQDQPAPKPVEAPVEMAPAPVANQGTVRLSGGGGVKVSLSGAAGSFSPGLVPEGSYRVVATFDDQKVTVGQLTVVANQSHTIKCVEAMKLCRLQ